MLNKLETEKRLQTLDLSIHDEFKSYCSSCLLRCSNGHIFRNIPSRMVSKNRRCFECSGTLRTTDGINRQLKTKGIEMIGDFNPSEKYHTFKCSNKNHIFEKRVGDVLDYKQCPLCAVLHYEQNIVGILRKNNLSIEYVRNYNIVNTKCFADHAISFNIYGDGPIICEKCKLIEQQSAIKKILSDNNICCSDMTINKQIKTFSCSNNHSWKSSLKHFLKTKKCPFCYTGAGRKIHTEENTRKLLEERGFVLRGVFVNSIENSELSCSYGHIWFAPVNRILRNKQYRCPHCCNRAKLTKDVINARIKNRNITLLDEPINTITKSSFLCGSCNNIWNTKIDCVINSGSGCPYCAKRGFSPNKKGCLYINRIFCKDGKQGLKFGITNGDHNQRSSKHVAKSNSSYSTISVYHHLDGQIIKNLEKSIKNRFKNQVKYLSKEELPDGYTETLPIECLAELILFVENFAQFERTV